MYNKLVTRYRRSAYSTGSTVSPYSPVSQPNIEDGCAHQPRQHSSGSRRGGQSHSEKRMHCDFNFSTPSTEVKQIKLFFLLCFLLGLSSFPTRSSRWLLERIQENEPDISAATAHVPKAHGTANLWDDSKTIPSWMKKYFAWHRSERSKLTRENWKSRRYLVLRCLATDSKCGGASDRLSSLPYMLLLANKTNRLLFIHWSRPAPLEEFLVPPVGGLNWSVPEVVNFTLNGVKGNIILKHANITYIVSEPANAYWAATDRAVVEARPKGTTSRYGERPGAVYDASREYPSEATFEQVFSDTWRVLFEPTPPVAARIQSALANNGLEAHKYVSAHVRAQHRNDTSEDTQTIKNALHCAMSLKPNTPIYIASDSNDVARFGVEYGRRVLNQKVVAVIRDEPPLHIDRGRAFLVLEDADWDQYPATAYYDTFVDLYLLSNGMCTTTGIGGYGQWSTMISMNASCSIKHNKVECPRPSSVLDAP